jgi:cobalt-zinc-cadmium efflux system membrane fusion protein
MKHLFILVTLALGTLSCSGPQDSGKKEKLADPAPVNHISLTDAQKKLLGIQLGFVEQRQISGVVKANGMLDVPPQNLVTISAPLGGFVKYTELLQGMKVKKGQVLVVMEHPDYIQMQQDYLDSKSQLDYLALEYKRQEDLAKDNVNAIKTLQQSKSNYFSTRAKVEGLKAKLRLININTDEIEAGQIRNTISIVSPITGYVTQVHINIGMHVMPTDVLLKIVDTEHLHAEAQVFEKDLPKLVIGQTVRIRLSNETKERLARVYLIGKEITPERTVRVHCHFVDHDPLLIPGLFFTALIETNRKSVSTLPNEAIVNYNGKYFVFLEDEKDAHQYEMVEIIEGLSEEGYTTVELPDPATKRSVVIKGTYALLGMIKNKED